jgi:hypothetical protein
MLNVFSFSQRKSPMVNRNTQIDDWKTTKPTSEKLGIHGSIILGLPKTEKFALMEINLKTLQTVRKSITILVRQRMSKMRHVHVMLMVWNTVENFASQMDRLTVRKVRHGSMTARSKPKAQLAQCVVTGITVRGRRSNMSENMWPCRLCRVA